MSRPGKPPIRSVDVAKLAGVSRATVSRALTEGAIIAPATRARVIQAAAALGYHPNAIARSLIMRRSGIVGVVFAELVNPFYGQLLETLCQELQGRGKATLLFSCRDADHLDELVPKLLGYQVDGVIIAAATLSSTIAGQCVAAGRPVVLINRYVDHGQDVHVVACDNRAGAAMVARHLVETGHRRIGFMAGLENTSSNRDREAGFTTELARLGLRLHVREAGNYTYAGALEPARRMLAVAQRPDAIFCANDPMAMAVSDVARTEYGLRVPEDLALAGFDNTAPAASPAYSLTTIDQNMGFMTKRAVDHLLAGDGVGGGVELVGCRLVTRRSTRPAMAA